MYKIIGVDGQQYGPVTAEDLKRWVAEHRANGQSLIQLEGSAEWKPLGTFPEFAEVLGAAAPQGSCVPPPPGPGPVPGAGSPPPPPPPGPPPYADPGALAAGVLATDPGVDIGGCLSRAWGLLSRHFWVIVGASFVLDLVQQVTFGLLAGVCMGGFYLLLLKLIRGERAQFADGFAGFGPCFLQLFLAGIVSAVLSSLGLIFCILPGIYLAVAWLFPLALVIDKKLDFWSAMELSRQVVSRHWFAFFGLLVVNFLVILLGTLCCLVGVFVAKPLAFAALAYAYEDYFGRMRPQPATL